MSDLKNLYRDLHELDELLDEYRQLRYEQAQADRKRARQMHHAGDRKRAMYRRYRNEKKLCPICQATFVVHDGNQKYCTPGCRHRAAYYRNNPDKQHRYFKRCVECGAGFVAKRSQALVCGKACRQKRNNRLRRKTKIRRAAGFPKVCAVCERSFFSSQAHTVYCSVDCRKDARRQRLTARRATPAEKACAICGTMFRPINKRHRYCSEPCRKEKARQRSRAWHRANKQGRGDNGT